MRRTIPTGYPGWASGASGWIVEPTASQKALGWQPNQAPPAGYQNWLQALTYDWLSYLSGFSLCGDGSDGTATLSGPTRIARDMFYENLTVTGTSGLLESNGFRVYVRDTLTTAGGGRIAANGNPGIAPTLSGGAGGAGGTGIPYGTVAMGATGGAGGPPGTGAGRNGVGGSEAQNSLGGGGGKGAGILITASGGTGGPVTLLTTLAAKGTPRASDPQSIGHVIGATGTFSTWIAIRGGGGGGGGAGSSVGGNTGGGGGGGGGGVLCVCAAKMQLAAGYDLQARGGDGAGGEDATTSPGGGGGGGVVLVRYGNVSTGITFFSPSCCAPGAAGVTGLTDGGAASAGTAGNAIAIPFF